MASASKSIPFVVPAQLVPAVERISQEQLGMYASLRARAKELQDQVAAAEESLKLQLQSGAAVEAGIFRAFLKTTERRSVPWKQVCERELGAAYCARVLGSTKPDTFTHLVVEA